MDTPTEMKSPDQINIFKDFKALKNLPENMYMHVEPWHHYACYQALREKCRPYDPHVYAIVSSFSINPDGTEKNKGYCCVSATKIAAMIGMERHAVSASIQRLIDCGLLCEVKRNGTYFQRNLHANIGHPAVVYGRACQLGTIGDKAVVENTPASLVEKFGLLLLDLADNSSDEQIAEFCEKFGGFEAISAYSDKLAARMKEGDSFLAAAEDIARDELATAAQSEAASIDEYESDYEALANRFAEHTTRMIDSPKSKHAYTELRESGYSAAEIDSAFSALEAHHAEEKTDGEQWPSMLSFLRGERSCRVKWGAKRLIDDTRAKAAREKAAADAAVAKRDATRRESERAAEIDRRTAELIAADGEYQAWRAELEELNTHLAFRAAPGTPAAAALKRHGELADLTTARLERYEETARQEYDAEHEHCSEAPTAGYLRD